MLHNLNAKRELLQLGYACTEFEISSEGSYDQKDAEFNYKDIPHLNVVHPYANQTLVAVGEDYYVAVHFQKILGVSLPFFLTNFTPSKSKQIATFSFWIFTFFVENHWQNIANGRCLVTTSYSIFSHKLFRVLHPLLRRIIEKNYKILMADDFPIRDRRGELRRRDFSFVHDKDENSLTYYSTLDIGKNNLVFPDLEYSFVVDKARLSLNDEMLIGDSLGKGFRLITFDDKISIYPRLCHHEGACLDEAKKKGKALTCPWHGRLIPPITTFGKDEIFQKTLQKISISVCEKEIKIHSL